MSKLTTDETILNRHPFKGSRLFSYKRVPVFRQLSAVECGAACLAMIMTYYGKPTSVSYLRNKCGVGRDGLTARALAMAARAEGFKSTSYSLESSLLSSINLPAILHRNFNHFVVLERWRPDRCHIVDPSGGHKIVLREEFDRAFAGIVMLIVPGDDFKKARANSAHSP